MKKIITKFSLLFIGLMLCAGNAWAAGTYHNEPANPTSGQDVTGCYYEETIDGITYRIDYTYRKTVTIQDMYYQIRRTPVTVTYTSSTDDYKYKNEHAYVTNVFTGSGELEFVNSISIMTDKMVFTLNPSPEMNYETTTAFPVCLKKNNFNNYSGKIKLPAYPEDGKAIVYEGWSTRDERYTDANYGNPFTYVFGENVTVEVPKFSDQARYNAQRVDYYGTALNAGGWAYTHMTAYSYPWNGHLTNRGEAETLSYVAGGQVDNVYWTLWGDGRLQITGSGAIPDVAQGASPWNAHVDGIYAVEIGADITAIGNYAFYNCSNLTEITFDGTNVTRIGDCCFQSCAKLQAITLPSGVTTLGAEIFSSDDYLMSVSLPATISTMPENVFSATQILNTVTILATNPTSDGFHSGAFNGISTLIIPDAAVCAYKDLWSDKTYVSYTSGEELSCVEQTCGVNLNWVINDGVLTISGTGTTMADYNGDDTPWYDSRNDITAIVFDAPNLEHIGNYAFFGFQNPAFTEVTIPNSVESIGSYAFRNCNTLTAIHLGSAVRTVANNSFSNCTALTEPICNGYMFVKMPTSYSGAYTIQAGTVEIKNNAFSGCTGLTSVTVPNSVTTMGSGVFQNCTSLASVTFLSPVTSISASTFDGCTSLTSFTVPNTVTSIGGSAFDGCTSLATVTLGTSVATIGNNAFRNCPLTSPLMTSTRFFQMFPANYSGEYIIPDGIVEIAAAAFNGCAGVTSVIISNTVTTIGDRAFQNCTSLATVTLGDAVATIGTDAFKNCPLTSPLMTSTRFFQMFPTNYSGAYTIPNGIESINSNAFKGCTGLTSAIIPNSVTNLGTGIFQGCSNMTSVTLTSGLGSTLPADMFKGCSSLAEFHFKGKAPSAVGNWDVFDQVPEPTTFYVPKGTRGAYITTAELAFWNYEIIEENVYGDATSVNENYSWTDEYWEEHNANYATASYNALVESASAHESVENFTIVRPIQANGYLNTICLPFDLSEAQIANSDLAEAEIFAFDAQNTGAEIEMVLNEVTEMEAGMPYFFRYPNGAADAPNLGELNFHGVTVKTATSVAKTVEAGTFRLKGTLQNTLLNSASNYLFLGAEDALFYPDFGGAGVTNDDLTLRPFRAYFERTSGNNAPARITFGRKTTTSVENIDTDKTKATKILENGQVLIIRNGVRYNVAGQVVK